MRKLNINKSKNAVKRTGISFLAAVMVMTVVFAINNVASPVSAQTNASSAAVKLNWTTGAAQTAANAAIYTIHYNAITCSDDILGGTLHKTAIATEDAVLGLTNSGTTILPTHINLSPSLATGANADACLYDLVVTSNLHCSFAVRFGNVAIGTFTKTSDTATTPTKVTVRIGGKATTSTTFFGTRETDLNNAAVGNLVWFNTSGVATDVAIVDRAVAASATATACNVPALASGFSLQNAEPVGSADLSLSVLSRSNCNADTSAGDFGAGVAEIDAGTEDDLSRVILDGNCTYNLSIPQGSAPQGALLKGQCTVAAAIYERPNTGASTVTIRIHRSTNNNLALSVDSNLRVVRTDGGGTNRIVHISLFVTSQCPQTTSLRLQYEITDGTLTDLGTVPVEARVLPATGSHAQCVASPQVVTLEGATSDRNSVDNSVEVSVVTRPVAGRTCSYVVTYPRVAGSLSLAAEPGNNFKTGTGAATRIAEPATGAVKTAQNEAFDGVITRSATVLPRLSPISFIYEARQLPISVTSIFPSDVTFTTNETVSYRITLTGVCARYSAIVARALGGEGTFRVVQAFPGTSLVFDPSLRELVSSTSQAAESLVEVNPVVVVEGTVLPCTVQVTEVSTPSGCTVVGGNIKTTTFSEGLSTFTFSFEHTCSRAANAAPTNSRGLTG